MYAATGGPNVKWGGTDLKWGDQAPLPPPAGDDPDRMSVRKGKKAVKPIAVRQSNWSAMTHYLLYV